MILHYKEYSHTNGNKTYYVTLNDKQVGPVHFTLKSVLKTIKNLKSGKGWE